MMKFVRMTSEWWNDIQMMKFCWNDTEANLKAFRRSVWKRGSGNGF